MAKSDKGSTQLKFGRYNALTKLGQGAMATVYLAEDPALNRMVAIKVIHTHLSSNANLLDRFTVEAKTAAGLRNPNIVEIFDYGLEDELQYLVMEYIDGPNLQFVLNLLGGQPMEPEVAAAIIFQAAEGLITADKNGVVHRDIKPENMMFTADGKLKIADFGIAHISEQNLTQTGSILGSPNFMSPEQIDGKKPTHQTDMFSLGACFYYCLSGKKPFTGPNIPTIMRNICDLPHASLPTIIPDVDPVLEKLVETLLEKAPENRGGGARWLSLQLRAYLNQKGVLDPSETTRDYLEKVGKMGNQTVIDLTPAPGPDETSGRSTKAPLRPGMKVERPKPAATAKPGTGIRPGTGVKPGTGIKPGTGVRTDTGSKDPFGDSSNATRNEFDFSGNAGKKSGTGSRPGNAKGKAIGLWVGAGLAGLAILILALILVLKPGKSSGGAEGKPIPPADNHVISVALQPATMELPLGQKRRIVLKVLPDNASAIVRWESANPSIASVQDGEVWGQNVGQTVIKAISMEDSGKYGTTEIIVSGSSTPQPENTSRPESDTKTGGATKTVVVNQDVGSTTNTNSNNSSSSGSNSNSNSNSNEDDPGADFVKTTVEKAPEKASATRALLTVTSAPPFAEVIVDGRFIGTTPVKAKELSTGRHKIQITHRSFPSIDTTVVLGVGPKELRFRLFR